MSAVESWFATAAVAEPLPRPRPARRASAPAKKTAQSRRNFRIRGSLVFMAVLALLLVGIVAVNVAVLRAHVSVNDLDAKIQQLQQENASLVSQYRHGMADPRIEAAASQAGFVYEPGFSPKLIDMAGGK